MEPIIATIFWLGQSCFVIQAGNQTILTDPYNPRMGYEVRVVQGVDIVTASHEHGDHNYLQMAAGDPLVLRGLDKDPKDFAQVNYTTPGLRIYAVQSYHDPNKGAQRGKNAIFVFEIQSVDPPLRIVHMGDFGETRLDNQRIEAIGKVDVLLVPVGGHYTIGAAEADRLIADLQPRVVVPMHYKTAKTPRLPISDASPFLEGKTLIRDRSVSGNRLTVTRSLLKKAEEGGAPLVAALEFGAPPAPRSQSK